MQTNLSPAARELPRAADAERVLRSCVHCGFCNATARPTAARRRVDGPRGRIYLIKACSKAARSARRPRAPRPLPDCRNCEPLSLGVSYHELLDIGRAEVERRVPQPAGPSRMLRAGLRQVLPQPRLFGALLKSGQALKPLLPAGVQAKLPARIAAPGLRPAPRHVRRMLILEGLRAAGAFAHTNAATARVLDRPRLSLGGRAPRRCCGAVDYHLNAQEAGLDRARRNIDAWWPPCRAAPKPSILDRQRLRRLRQGIRQPAQGRSGLCGPRRGKSRRAPATWWRCCANCRWKSWRLANTRGWPSIALAPCRRPAPGAAPWRASCSAWLPAAPVPDGTPLLWLGRHLSLTQPDCRGGCATPARRPGERSPEVIATATSAAEPSRRRRADPVRHWIEILDAAWPLRPNSEPWRP